MIHTHTCTRARLCVCACVCVSVRAIRLVLRSRHVVCSAQTLGNPVPSPSPRHLCTHSYPGESAGINPPALRQRGAPVFGVVRCLTYHRHNPTKSPHFSPPPPPLLLLLHHPLLLLATTAANPLATKDSIEQRLFLEQTALPPLFAPPHLPHPFSRPKQKPTYPRWRQARRWREVGAGSARLRAPAACRIPATHVR